MISRASATGPVSRAGSPGPGESTTPTGPPPRRSLLEVLCGCTRTRRPRDRSARTMLDLSPKSTTTTSGSLASPYVSTRVGETCATKSSLSHGVINLVAATAASKSLSHGAEMRARCAPVSRKRRARLRVSTPAIAGTLWARSSAASCAASSLIAAVACATTSPRSHGRVLWSSAISRP